MESDQNIISQISTALREMIAAHYGPEAVLLDTLPARSDREWSTFLQVQVYHPAKGQFALIVKIPRGEGMISLADVIASDDLGDYAGDEFAGLQKIEQAVRVSGNEDLAAITALGTLPAWGAIVMEYLAFRSLKSIALRFSGLLLKSHPDPHLLGLVSLAGVWLRTFHEAARQPDPARLATLDVRDQTHAYLAYLSLLAVGEKNFRPLQERFQSRFESLRSSPVPVAELHEDFHFSNVFITEAAKVGGFDPAVGKPGPIYQDLSHFITDPQLWWQQALGGGFLIPRQSRIEVRSAFLAGYGGEINAEVLDYFCAMQVVRRWQILAERVLSSGKLGPPWIRSLILRFVRGYYLRLLDEYLP